MERFCSLEEKTIGINFTMSMLEIASLSENLGTTSKWIEIAPQNPNRIHPTEKPIKLYEWLLMNYANQTIKYLILI
jgi:site-specific DNA-methyltransferase (adenine-specific)